MKTLAVCLVAVLVPCNAYSARFEAGQRISGFGDSFFNDYSDWPNRAGPNLSQNAFGGRTLAHVGAHFLAEFADDQPAAGVVLAAGVNDTIQGASLGNLQSHVHNIMAMIPTELPVVVATLPPIGCASGVSASELETAEQFNEWIRTIPRIDVFDVNLVLDADGDGCLDAEFDSGDGLHPTNDDGGGHTALANAFDQQFLVPEPNSAVLVLTTVFCLLPRFTATRSQRWN